MKLRSLISLLLLSSTCDVYARPQDKNVVATRQTPQKQKRLSSAAKRREMKKNQITENNNTPSTRRYASRRQKNKEKTTSESQAKVIWTQYSGEEYSFQIPSDWQCIDDKTQLPEKLDVVFIGKGLGALTPTINIAQEITSKHQSDYIDEVLAYHRDNEFTLESSVFSRIQSPSGEFTIIKTEKNSSWGKVFCLQGISIINHTAYVFTVTTTLDDYSNVSLIFLKTVSSFKLSEKNSASGDAILEEALRTFLQEKN